MLGIFSGDTPFLPRIVPVVADESRYAFTVIGKNSDDLLILWHTPIEPWGVPNGTVDTLSDNIATNPETIAYAVAPSANEGAYALVEDAVHLPGEHFFVAVTPGMGGFSDILQTQQPGEPRSRFIARRDDDIGGGFEHLVGYEMSEGDRRRLAVRIVSQTWGNPEHPLAAACADAPIAATSVGAAGVFFIAAASSRALGQCDDPADAFGPPNRLQLTIYNKPLGQVLSLAAEWQESAPIEQVELTPDGDALWISYALADSPSKGRVRLLRVDLAGKVLAGPLDVATITRPAAFAAARLGSRLAIASREATETGQTIVPVRVITAAGEEALSFKIVPEAADEVAMVGEPNGKRLLVALTRKDPGAAHVVELLRYGCE
ncbi:MAG: hypothetical protein QM820_07350 [Minicystis sp.]